MLAIRLHAQEAAGNIRPVDPLSNPMARSLKYLVVQLFQTLKLSVIRNQNWAPGLLSFARNWASISLASSAVGNRGSVRATIRMMSAPPAFR
jgi:hypothetical protein